MLQSKSRDRVDTNLDANNQIREMPKKEDREAMELGGFGEASTKPMTPTQTYQQSVTPSTAAPGQRRNILIGQSTRSLNY